jgi:nicotinamide mononucleotide transporter
MIRQNVWTWPVGLVQVSVSAWLFYQTKLYSDALLQIFFFGIQVYGWWHWRHGRTGLGSALPVTRLAPATRYMWIVVGAAGTAGWGVLMRHTTDAALPFWDAFILVFSLIAQWLQARKHIENWGGWILVNSVAIGVFWAKDLRLYSALYAVFLGLAVMGDRAWRQSLPPRSQP